MLPKFSVELTDSQFKTLSEISRDIGQVFFATLVVPLVFGLDKAAWYVITSGTVGSIVFWFLSIQLAKDRR